MKDKVVVITGGSSGIGKALAFDALNRGACVAVCARNINKLEELYGNIAKERMVYMPVDVTSQVDCERLVTTVVDKWGKVDVLLNNAGISMRALFEDANVSVIKELMDVNFFGSVYCTKAALPHILKQKGVIVGVSSIAGYRGLPARTGYAASKFALQGFLECLRTELLHTGTHVMWVAPGFTTSNIRNVARAPDGSMQGETPLDEKGLMSAEECAGIILDAVQKRKRSVVMTFMGKMTVFINRIWPGFVDKRAYRHFLNEPNSPLKKYETNG
ncbi:MAG: SDR family oxidoreductase [Chitinophagales bacterium]|nr:SDR family oxidoreductase [Chitinophagales bacterium]